jgi:hypothetical protein
VAGVSFAPVAKGVFLQHKQNTRVLYKNSLQNTSLLSLSPAQHGEQNDSQRPNITSSVISLLPKHFRSDKVRRIAGRHQESVLCTKLLRETEITDSETFCPLAELRIHDIRWLQVTMYNLNKPTNCLGP